MLDLMMGMKALQRPVIELLLDMMLDLCDRLPDAYPSSEPAPPSSAAHTPHSVPHRSQRCALPPLRSLAPFLSPIPSSSLYRAKFLYPRTYMA